MIDIHCHILPGIDDGAKTMEQALKMAQFAVEQGTTGIVFTPHIHPGRYENDRESIRQIFDLFRAEIKKINLKLQLGMAAEVRLSSELLKLFESSRIPFLGSIDSKDILLLEFPHGNIPDGSTNLVDWLIEQNCRVLIAHPERNKDVMRNPDILLPFLERNCLLQVTAGSLTGNFGSRAQEIAELLLAEDYVYILATDSHNLNHRTPDLMSGYLQAKRLVGDKAAHHLVYENPLSIVQSQLI